MLKSTSLTHRFVCHAHISRCPATKSTGQVIGFLHGGLGWVIGKLCGDACGPGGEGVHAAGTVKAIGASMIQKIQQFIHSTNVTTHLPIPDLVPGVRNSRENCKGGLSHAKGNNQVLLRLLQTLFKKQLSQKFLKN